MYQTYMIEFELHVYTELRHFTGIYTCSCSPQQLDLAMSYLHVGDEDSEELSLDSSEDSSDDYDTVEEQA